MNEAGGSPQSVHRRFNPSRWAIEHAPLTRYLMWVLLVLGGLAYFQLSQDEDPPFVFRAMVVQAAWPGATAREVAEQVTDKIERALQEVPHVDIIRSYAKPAESLTIFQVREDTPKDDVQQTWYQVRKKVGDIRPTLPQGVQGPFFNDEFGEVYGSIYTLSADGFSDEELRRFAEQVRHELLRVPDVAKVELFGVQPERVYVEVSAQRLAQLGLDWPQVISQIGAQNTMESAGLMKAGERDLQVRVDGQYRSLDDLARLSIKGTDATTGQPRLLRLGDIAILRRAYADPPAVKVRSAGKAVLALGVSMTKGGDILRLGKSLRQRMPSLQAQLPVGVELRQVLDQPETVSTAVNEFVGTLTEAVVIVLAVSFLTLGLHRRGPGQRGWRIDVWPGVVVAITIPLVLAITFICMHYWGIGLHKVSLGSLIIALGLLVDDAIIAVEMMVRKLEEGHERVAAATYAYEVTSVPMLTGTLITAAGFLPIGLARSSTGEYTFSIFAVTTLSLVLSWIVSVYFVPYLGARLLRVKPAPQGGVHELYDTPFYTRLRRLVDACVTHRGWAVAAVVLSFVLGLVGMTLVPQQFFPDSNRPEILVDLWLPEGANQEASEAVVRRFETLMAREHGVESNLVWVGSGLPRFFLPLDQVFPQPNVSQALLRARTLEARDDLVRRLPALLAQSLPEVRVRVKLLQTGPPVQYPVQYRLIGPDPEVLKTHAKAVREVMQSDPQLTGVNDNWNQAVLQLQVDVDEDQARLAGVSRQAILQATRTLLSGTTVGEYREEDRLIPVVLRQPVNERSGVEALTQTYVLSTSGRAVPLAQLVRVSPRWEPGVLWREGRQFAITVNADVLPGVQGPTASARLWPKLQSLAAHWPQGYRVEIAGAAEQSGKGQGSILAGLPIMVFLIVTLLMLQLKSFSRAVLVLLTGPLGISGIAAALLLLGRPFGFVALLGVIALMGMIMRNAVILIDQIEQERARGVPAWEAIVESAVRRFRPIVLTAAAAVLAMIPLSRSVFWGPMAVAIMGGLIVATALTLLGLPAMYAAWFRIRKEAPAAAG